MSCDVASKNGFLLTARKWVEKKTPKAENRDDDLVVRALEGDTDSYRVLVERYQQRVFAVVMGVMGNVEDAKDVTQEAFVKAFKNLSSFRRQSSFYTWIYRIAFNLSIDEKRRRYRHVEQSIGDSGELDRSVNEASDANLVISHQLRPDQALSRRQFGEQVDEAMKQLSPEHRAVIMLREVDGLSYEEISNIVGCSKGTVMSRLHHARKKLKVALIEAFEKAGVLDEYSDYVNAS